MALPSLGVAAASTSFRVPPQSVVFVVIVHGLVASKLVENEFRSFRCAQRPILCDEIGAIAA